MELRQLKYFVTAIEAGTLTRAAELLSVAQPAVSQQILKLEEELGEQLLMRHSRGVGPTEAGVTLLRHATAVLRQIEMARQDLSELRSEPVGQVRIGMPRSVSKLMAIEFFLECRRRLPKIGLAMVERLSEELNDLVADGRLDLVFSYNPEATKVLAYEPLAQLELSLIASPDAELPVSTDQTVPFACIASLPLILPTRPHGLRQLVEEVAASRNVPLVIKHEVDSITLIADMVIAGLGYSIQPQSSVQRSVAGGLLVSRLIVEPTLSRTLYLAYSRRHPLSHAQLAVKALMRGMGERIHGGEPAAPVETPAVELALEER